MKIFSTPNKITKSIHLYKQNIIHKINPNRCKYVLLSKSEHIDVKNFQDTSILIPEKSDTFTRVSIGKRDDKTYKKEIITFYEKGVITKRLTKDSENNEIIRTYENRGFDTNSRIHSRRIETKVYNKTTNQHEFKTIDEYKTYKSEKDGSIKLQLAKNEYNGDKISASITEFPFVGRKKFVRYLIKKLGLDLEIANKYPHITGTYETTNVKFPSDDKYLPFRFILDRDTKVQCLTKHYIMEKGLERLEINIRTSSDVKKGTDAYFNVNKNEIVFNTTRIGNDVDSAAHEVEHAYQYCQMGRIGKGNSQYHKDSRKLYGAVDNLKDMSEAHKYAIALEKYPDTRIGENWAEKHEYKDNYLEIKARKAGAKAQKEYDSEKFLSKQFFFGLT